MSAPLVVLAAALVALSVVLTAWRRRDLREHQRKELIAAHFRRHSGARTLQEGATVTLTGIVRAVGKQMEAPLSGKPCVAHASRVDKWKLTALRRKYVGDVREVAMVPFVIEVSQGSILVDARQATIDLPDYPTIPRKVDRELAFLRKHGVDGEDVLFNGFREVLVVPGDRVSVAGVVVVARDELVEHGYRDAPMVARLIGSERFPLAIGKPT